MSLEHIFRRSLIFLVWRLKGLKTKSLYKELLEREYWTSEQWEKYQKIKLKKFLEYCYQNVPFYKNLFEKNNIVLDNGFTIDELSKIPVLTKDIARENTNDILSSKFSKDELTAGHTTGSTGKPFSYYGGVSRKMYLTAGLWRIYQRCGWKPGERIASIWGFKPTEMQGNSIKMALRDYFNGISRFNAWKANDEDFALWYKKMKKQKVTLMVCYSSTGSRFAKWLLDNKLKLNKIKGVYCTSEKLYEEQKYIIEKAFNCSVYDLYGCGEVNHIACSCEKGKMHINLDMVYVEQGKENEIGQTPFILTGYSNLAMPFVRYMNGDSGKISNEKCDCGRHTPVLDLSISRLADVFTFADGKKYPSLYFVLRLYRTGFDGIELFQFHQDKIDHIYLRVVKNGNFDEKTQLNLEKIVNEIEGHIKHQAKVELLFTDYIEQSSTSKHYYAKSEIK